LSAVQSTLGSSFSAGLLAGSVAPLPALEALDPGPELELEPPLPLGLLDVIIPDELIPALPDDVWPLPLAAG
jgi:hypothetical protein